MTKYSIFDVANWFLAKEPMSHKKVQKLCYYAVAWGYALLNRPIVSQPEFQAWVHGPVSPDLYKKYAGNAWVELDPDPDFMSRFDDVTLDLLESVWLTYGSESANALEALTHSEPPWIRARGTLDSKDNCSNPIQIQDMREYYLSIYIGGEE